MSTTIYPGQEYQVFERDPSSVGMKTVKAHEHLKGLNFNHKTFENFNFTGCVIDGCSFRGATFKGCNFSGTKIKNSDIHESCFQECVFSKADLRHVSMSDVSLVNTKIINSQIKDSTIEDSSFVGQSSVVGTQFKKSGVIGVQFGKSVMTLTTFSECSLKDSNISQVRGGSDTVVAYSDIQGFKKHQDTMVRDCFMVPESTMKENAHDRLSEVQRFIEKRDMENEIT